MQNRIQKKDHRFLKIFRIFKYLKKDIRLLFLILIRLIEFHFPFKYIKFQVINLLTYSLIFPPASIILGSQKAHIICDSFENIFCPSGVLPLPPPLRSKIIIPRHRSYIMPYFEIYLADVYCKETLREKMNVVDVGAHIGIYTVLVAEKVGKSGKVIAVEPEPKNYKQLIENINLNNFQNVIPKNIALTDHEGSEKLYFGSSPDGHSLIPKEDKTPSIEVTVKTLDNLLEELNLRKVNLIKIDAEGTEIPILKGAEKTLKANPNIKIIVATEHYPSETEEVCQFLNERGLKTKILREDIVITI